MKASFSLNGYMLIGGEVATVDQINDIIAERDNALTQNAELVAQNKELGRLLKASEKQTEQLTLIALGEINLRDRDAEAGRAAAEHAVTECQMIVARATTTYRENPGMGFSSTIEDKTAKQLKQELTKDLAQYAEKVRRGEA